MNSGFRSTSLLLLSLIACSLAAAQATPTAIQRLTIYGFGAATGTYTGLDGGKNLGITAGVDVAWRPYYRFYPSVEARGTYPVDGGQVDAQKDVLYGFKAARYYGRFHPYADFLIGRDKIKYENGGFPNSSGTLLYLDSVSNVISPGGGLDLDITDQFALKLDAQFQRIGVPVNATGHIYSKPLTIGIVYRLDFNHHLHYDRDGNVKGYKPPPPPKAEVVPPPPDPDTAPAPADSTAPVPDNSTPPPAPNSAPPAPDNPPTTGTSNPPPADTSTPPAKPSPDTPAPTPQPQPQ